MPRIAASSTTVRVCFSAREVEAFARRWPCFGPAGRAWISLDRRTGDLMDFWMAGYSHDPETGESTHDESGILALSHAANNLAVTRGYLPEIARR